MNLNEARLMVGPTFHMFVPFKGLLDESSSHDFLRKILWRKGIMSTRLEQRKSKFCSGGKETNDMQSMKNKTSTPT